MSGIEGILVLKNTGETFWTAAIQRAENEAHAKFVSTGVKQRVIFPTDEPMVLHTTIYKRSGVDWIGPASIVRNSDDTNIWALVLADNVRNFEIQNIAFSNLQHAIAVAKSWSKETRNCCIHVYGCTEFSIDRCRFSNYSEGIVRTGCSFYKITNNFLRSGVTGKSLDQFYDDTYVNIAGAQTGDIVGWVLSGDIPMKDYGSVISGNHCLSEGLRIGIEVLTQAANLTPSIISQNIVKGLHQGIKVYKGTYTDYSAGVTHVREVIISNNHISHCREAGIYVRANHGVLVQGNYITDCALFDTGDGTAYAGILTRVSATTINPNLNTYLGNLVVGNFVTNVGKTVGKRVEGKGIQVRTENTKVADNKVVQSNPSLRGVGHGVLIGNGDTIYSSLVESNEIRGFSIGVAYLGGTRKEHDRVEIRANSIVDTTTLGIQLEGNSKNSKVLDNNINYGVSGIRIKKQQNTIVKGNIIEDMTGIAIIIASGTYAGDVLTPPTRTNPTTQIIHNVINRCNVSHGIIETASGDTTFAGRCKTWLGDIVEGSLLS